MVFSNYKIHLINFIILLIILHINGCATTHYFFSKKGIPQWDSENEGLKFTYLSGVINTPPMGVINIPPINYHKNNSRRPVIVMGLVASTRSEHVQTGIKLKAAELNELILTSLTSLNTLPERKNTLPTEIKKENFPDLSNAWAVSNSNEDQIITDWKRIKGRKAGILWWLKEYECEVRHIITLKKSLDNPEETLSYSILTEVQERPNENYKWEKVDSELGRESFETIKNKINESIRIELLRRGYIK